MGGGEKAQVCLESEEGSDREGKKIRCIFLEASLLGECWDHITRAAGGAQAGKYSCKAEICDRSRMGCLC